MPCGIWPGVLDLVELEPWAGGPQSPSKPDGNMRVMPFARAWAGDYLVMEPQREVYIVRV